MPYSEDQFKEAKWYVERTDQRLGHIYLYQTAKESLIAKIIQPQDVKTLTVKLDAFQKTFARAAELALRLQGIGPFRQAVISRSSPRLPSDTMMIVVEAFSKDLNDEVNVRRLKGIEWDSSEIFNLLFICVIVYSMMEEAGVPIAPIRRNQILVVEKQFKIFAPVFFSSDPVEWASPSDQAFAEHQFLERRKELLFLLLCTKLLLPEPEKFQPLPDPQVLIALLDPSNHLTEVLATLLADDAAPQRNFVQLRTELIARFPEFEYEPIDPAILKNFR